MPAAAIRTRLRAARRAVPRGEARTAAHAAVERSLEFGLFEDLPEVALSVCDDGELDPGPLGAVLRESGHRTWYPVVGGTDDDPPMTFRHWDGSSPLEAGRFGIPVPPAGEPELAAEDLSAVVMPLVAFDLSGHRLGRGAGYYDRTFAPRGTDRRSGPLLVGWAYDFQQVENLDIQPWDVPLDYVVTPTTVHRF